MTPTQQFIFNLSASSSAILWLVCYALIIRRGFKDRTYGMPLAPLCVNMSYEFIFGILHPDDPPMNYANIAWILVDLVIVYQYLRFAPKEFPAQLPRQWFYPAFVLALTIAFAGVLSITYEFQDWHGNYTGWGDQLLISITFSCLLLRRQSVRGQSLYIVLSRMLGSIVLIPGQYIQAPHSIFLAYVWVAFVVLDSIYIMLYLRQCRLENINPWTRF
jgi:hypothetical protein